MRDKHAFETFLENKERTFIDKVIEVFERIIATISSKVADNRAVKDVIASLKELATVAAEAVEKGEKEDEKARFSLQNNVSAEELAEIEAERKSIIETAKANGTYLKAPNGKKTNLTPEQWVDVRTSRFKKWFGDWEKVARIEKLRNSESVVVPEDVNVGKYELNRESAEAYLLNELRGEYTIVDTNEKVTITRKGAKKVTSHSVDNVVHLKSIAVIPQMLENAIFIEESAADKGNAKYDTYRYYVCGLRIGNNDYTVRITIGVKGGKYYYDHSLTSIEKGNLIEIAQGFTPNGGLTLPSYAESKDKRIIPILQTKSSKIVDENGEPKVMYHGDRKKARYIFSTDTFFTPKEEYAKRYTNGTGEVYATFLDIKRPFDIRDKKAYDIFTEFRGGRKPVATTTGAMDWGEYSYEDLQEYVEDVAPNEYDGFILDEGADPDGNGGVVHRGLSFVPFAPNQIKSATDNVGTYNANNADIRYSLITPEMDASYLEAVKRGDMATAQKMVMEAAKLAMPDTKVVDEDGNRYYDHNLTAIAKGKLIDIANNEQSAVTSGFGTTPDTESTTNSHRKYKELVSIIQINSSKIVDENGEPKVVYHQTNATIYRNIETGQNWDDLDWRERMEWDERDDCH